MLFHQRADRRLPAAAEARHPDGRAPASGESGALLDAEEGVAPHDVVRLRRGSSLQPYSLDQAQVERRVLL